METAKFTLGEAFQAIDYSPTAEQWKILNSFDYKIGHSFSVKVLEGIDAPAKAQPLIQPSKPSQESILEKYLSEKHGVRISHFEVSSLQDKSRKLATTKSSQESTAEFIADWDPLAGKHGRQKAAIKAGTLATQRMAEASTLATQAASKLQELTQWTQFAITQDDFKSYKEQILEEHEITTAANKQKYTEENKQLLETRSQYDNAFRLAREEMQKSCAVHFLDWLNSSKYKAAEIYQENALVSGLVNYLAWSLEFAIVISSSFIALLVLIPVHIWLLRDACVGRWLIARTNGIPRWSSLKPEWNPAA
jgi:hypothetical protein